MDNIERKMIELSNNSHLTRLAATIVNDKLSESDKGTFERWLDLTRREHQTQVDCAKKRFGRF
jgi:hypothetical protein